MVETIIFSIIAGLIGVLFWCVWALIANMITYTQRTILGDITFRMDRNDNYEKYKRYLNILNEVSYTEHFNRLKFFKNPLHLYPLEMQEDYRKVKNRKPKLYK